MFPPTDPRWREADSLDLLKRAYLRVVETGFTFVSADITVIIEQPRLARYVDDMRENLAGALVSGYSTISVKAKTNEGMGWIGKGEGVRCSPWRCSSRPAPERSPRVPRAPAARTAVRSDHGARGAR